MISIEKLTKTYGQHIAVDSISFSVGRGETLGLLGPNGAGKTTTMRMITGYLPPSDGRVLIDGMDMFDHPDEVKKRIGYLPEHPPLYLDLTVAEYLEFSAKLRGVTASKVRNRINDVAELCGIDDKLGRLTGNLSKGYRQRVGLAQALVHDPDILIFDEPTSGLDPRQIIEIRNLIRELGRERTVILSSHILQEVTSVCDKVAIINQGRLAACDTLEGLTSGEGSGMSVRIVVSNPDRVDMGRLRAIDGVERADTRDEGLMEIKTLPGLDLRPDLARILVEMDAGIVEMKSVKMSLEDIFMKVVSGVEQGTELSK